MIVKRRLSLFPIIFQFKRFGLTFQRVGNCCSMDHYKLEQLLFLHFCFRDKYYWRCRKCGKLHCVELSYHLVPYSDTKMREENKRLEDFRNGNR